MSNSICDRSNVSAWVILNKKGEHVATARAVYGRGGGVSVEVFNVEPSARARSLETALATGKVTPKALAAAMPSGESAKYYQTERARLEYAAAELFSVQRGRAGGYGYDKKAAAFSGLIVDGHTLANHCGGVPEDEKKRARLFAEYWRAHDSADLAAGDRDYWEKRARKIGCSFANWQSTNAESIARHIARGCTEEEARELVRGNGAPPRVGRYTSLYFREGFSRLEMLGYRVITAV